MNRTSEKGNHTFALATFWLYVGIPLVWGVLSTLQKAMALFA